MLFKWHFFWKAMNFIWSPTWRLRKQLGLKRTFTTTWRWNIGPSAVPPGPTSCVTCNEWLARPLTSSLAIIFPKKTVYKILLMWKSFDSNTSICHPEPSSNAWTSGDEKHCFPTKACLLLICFSCGEVHLTSSRIPHIPEMNSHRCCVLSNGAASKQAIFKVYCWHG